MRTKLESKIIDFINNRAWKQFHTPKNLVVSIGAEVGELMECFQWKSEEEINQLILDKKVEDFSDEIADIYIYLVSLCDSLNIDMEDAVYKKIEKNSKKYPIEKSFGNSKKYTDI